ncbi:MAG TPA: hypothetical protein VFZ58_02815 [Candidatus Saccharimonadales bacterium]
MPVSTKEKRAEIAARREGEYAKYEAWRREHEARDPVLLTLDSLQYDLRTTGKIDPEAWAQFDADEMTFLAENINSRHTTPARYRFNGHDVIVAEAQANRPELTLRSINEGGLKKAQKEALADERYYFQYRRDELFMAFHDEIISMMQGESEADTLIKFSTFPIEATTDNRRAILKEKAYKEAAKMGFLYIARRLPEGELELLTIRLDDCTPDIVTECLRDYGFTDAPFALEKSEEFGKYIVKLRTNQFPAKDIEAATVAQFDVARCKVRGLNESSYGRNETSVDALQFITQHQDYWAAYKAYNEQLARALEGEAVSPHLLHYFQRSLQAYESAGSSVLSPSETDKIVQSIKVGKLNKYLAAAYKKVLFHANVGLFKDLFESYKKTGKAQQLTGESATDMLGGYADSAAKGGASMAVRGESAAGCGLTIAVSVNAAAELAAQQGISVEEATRRLVESSKKAEERKKKLVPKHANDKQYLIEKWGKKNVKILKEKCGACGEKRYVAICGVCPDCDHKDTQNPGYITKLLQRRQRAAAPKKNVFEGLLFTAEKSAKSYR